MNKKTIVGLLLAVVLAVAGCIVLLAGPANANTQKYPYEVSQTWYKAGGTLDDIWPQSTDAITCGGIKQVDKYTIKNKDVADDYAALLAGGVLAGSSSDSEFSPHSYTVTLLKACITTVTAPTLDVVPPTCTADGTLPFLNNPPAENPNGYEFPGKGYRVYISPAFTGPGVYTATIQKVGPGFDSAFPGGTKVVGDTSQTLTVLPKVTGNTCTDRIPVPSAPVLNPATCDASGSLIIPANTDQVKYLVDNEQVNDGQGGSVTTPGDHIISAHTTIDYLFVGDVRSQEWTETIPAQLTDASCTPVTTPPATTTPPVTTPPTTPKTNPVVVNEPIPSSSSEIGTPVHVKRVANTQPLATTGVKTSTIILLAFFLLLGGAGLLCLGRHGKRS